MNKHIVQQGDSTSSIASKYGLKEWKLIYEHPDNAALRSQRGPNEVKADDVVFIPAVSEANLAAGGPTALVATGGKTVVLPPVIFDAHMHIMSGNCTPLPSLYQKLKDDGIGLVKNWRMRRTNINRMGKGVAWIAIAPQIGDISHRNTQRIGEEAVKSNNSLLEDQTVTYPSPDPMVPPTTVEIPSAFKSSGATQALIKAKESFVGISVVLTMDMDYCHLDGYEGKPVYENEGGKITYYHREKPHDRGEKFETESDEVSLFESWNRQLLLTDRAVAENPFRLLPLYHYEPRRYVSSEDKTLPFDAVATESQAGSFLGFKMYTPLGYMPTERHGKVKDILSWFFKECASKKIPVMNHCTPSGFYTHDRRFYLDHEPDDGIRARYQPSPEALRKADEEIKVCKDRVTREEATWRRVLNPLMLPLARRQVRKAEEEKEELYYPGRIRYFYENFVHPDAWKGVLEANPSLHLCLAHFASDSTIWKWQTDPAKRLSVLKDNQGVNYSRNWLEAMVGYCKTYDNFYTDISYLDLMDDQKWKLLAHILATNEHMRKKIMFGTDWYMITAEPVEYTKWFRKTLAGLELVEQELAKQKKPMPNLFAQFAVINPTRFYRLVEVAPKLKDGIKDLQSVLKVSGDAPKVLADNFATVMRLEAPMKQLEKVGGLLSDGIDYTPTPKAK